MEGRNQWEGAKEDLNRSVLDVYGVSMPTAAVSKLPVVS